jgi:hypothetical protein
MTLPRSTFLIVAAGLLLGITMLGYPRTALDTPAQAYAGQVILDGGVLYRDVWDVRGPALFLSSALNIALLGKSVLAQRVYDGLWQLATALVLAAVARRIYRRELAALLAGLSYLVLYNTQDFWSWAQPDGALNLPMALGCLGLACALESDRLLHWAAAGAGVALAVLFKFPLGLAGVGFPCAALLKDGPAAMRWLKRPAALAAGFVLPLAAMAIYLYAIGGLGPWWEAESIYAPQFASILLEHVKLSCVLPRLKLRPVLLILATLGIGLAGLWLERRRGNPLTAAHGCIVLVALAGLAVVVLHGFNYVYLFLPVAAPAAVLAAGAWSGQWEEWRARRSKLAALILLASLATLWIPAGRLYNKLIFTRNVFLRGIPADDPLREPGEYIKARTRPEDTILVWGNAAGIYLHAERKAASRFLCLFPLSPQLRRLPFAQILTEELTATRPVYIVVLQIQRTSFDCTFPIDEEAFLRNIPAVQQLLDSRYRLEKTEPAYRIYRRMD